MNNQQIFKPFEQFAEGEFDQMFNRVEEWGGATHTLYMPRGVILFEEDVILYHIVENKGKNGKSDFNILLRPIYKEWAELYELGSSRLCFDPNDRQKYIGFESLKAAYEAIRGLLVDSCVFWAQCAIQSRHIHSMTFEDFLQFKKEALQKEHEQHGKDYRNLLERVAKLSESLAIKPPIKE